MERSFDERAQSVLANLQTIRTRINEACSICGRSPDEITLMAVTKTVPAEVIQVALDAGVTVMGENRVQEFLGKRDTLQLTNTDVHLIGHLQTNKVKQIVGTVSTIQSVDSLRLAEKIAEESCKQGVVTNVLVEVNVGAELSKSGVSLSEAESLLRQIAPLSGIRVSGLMCIPPIAHTSEEKRQNFSLMHQLFIDIRGKNIDNVYMDILSMGMSDDYFEAILEGATLIRVGSALFGHRT